MELVPVTDSKQIGLAFQKLQRSLTSGASAFTRTIGFRGGNSTGSVWWRPIEQMWFHFNATGIKNRYWCCYGLEDASKLDQLSITTEINPPKNGFDRSIAGAFLTDGVGTMYLAHSGKVGGGKPGVGKLAFLESCPGLRMATVNWPDGVHSDIALIANLDDAHLPLQIQSFVTEVSLFKRTRNSRTLKMAKSVLRTGFSPEYEGARKPYRTKTEVNNYCDHGAVVRTLKELIEQSGIALNNDLHRDLYQLNDSSLAKILIEIKTSIELSAIYEGTGQLLINGSQQDPKLVRVLALPEGLPKKNIGVLRGLGLEVLEYIWVRGKPRFKNIDAFIKLCCK